MPGKFDKWRARPHRDEDQDPTESMSESRVSSRKPRDSEHTSTRNLSAALRPSTFLATVGLPATLSRNEDPSMEIGHTSQPQSIDEDDELSSHDLWELAYQKLKEDPETSKIISAYDEVLGEDIDLSSAMVQASPLVTKEATREEKLAVFMRSKCDAAQKAQVKFTVGAHTIEVGKQIDRIIRIVIWGKDYISQALPPDPYVSTAWAGICLVLPLLLNHTTQKEDALAGVVAISDIVCKASVVDELYQKIPAATKNQIRLRHHFKTKRVDLYAKVMEFEIRLVCHLSRNKVSQYVWDIVKLDNWSAMTDEINATAQLTTEDRNLLDALKLERGFSDLRTKQDAILLGITQLSEQANVHHEEEWEWHKRLEALILSRGGDPLNPVQKKPFTPIFIDSPFDHDVKNFVPRIYYTNALQNGFKTRSRMLLHGLGGVGKSQIAMSYVRQFREEYSEASVVWVYAASRSTFIDSYRRIAIHIPDKFRERHRETFQQASHSDPDEEGLALVRDWFSSPDAGQWLMILDNADDINLFIKSQEDCKSIISALPQSDTGNMIITSRDQGVASILIGPDEDCRIPVETMLPEEAVVLFRNILPHDSATDNEICRLADKLDWLPLAIKQATSFIANSATYGTISGYSDLFNDTENQTRLLQREFGDPTRPSDLRNSVVVTWQISFQQIENSRPVAAHFLSFIGVLSREGIPVFLLKSLQSNKIEFDEDITILTRYSLVDYNVKYQSLSIHRLVQVTIDLWLIKCGKQAEWQTRALNIVKDEFLNAMSSTGTEKRNLAKCRALYTHAQVVTQYHLQSEVDKHVRDELVQSINEFEKLGLNWLHSVDVDKIHANFQAKMTDGTADWLLQCPEYVRWRNADTGIFWLLGRPGSGKSIIASHIVEILKTTARQSFRVLFFYISYNAASSAEIIFRELLHQLCSSENHLPKPVQDLHARYESGTQMPGVRELVQVFSDVLRQLRHEVFVIIDALDECTPSSRFGILEAITLLNQMNFAKFHLFVTSRIEPENSDRFQNSYVVHIEHFNVSDIDLYLKQRIKTKYKHLQHEQRAKIEDSILSHANGSYKLANAIWEEFEIYERPGRDWNSFQQQLDSIPKSLFEIYQAQLARISPELKEVARDIFMWLCFVKRPLSIQELLDAIQEPGNRSTASFEEVQDVTRTVGLISIASDRVRFSHQTACEFILYTNTNQFFGLDPSDHRFFEVEFSSLRITSRCLDCLLACTTPELSEQTLKGFPLIQYAAEYWYQHLLDCSKDKITEEIVRKCTHLFNPTTPQPFLNWLRIFDPANPSRGLCLNVTLANFPSQLEYVRICGIEGWF